MLKLEIMMANDDGKIKSLFKFLEKYKDKTNLTEEGFLAFKEIHDSENYQCEMRIVGNLVFSQDCSLSGKVGNILFGYESIYHSKKLDCVHLCIMTHMVNILQSFYLVHWNI